MISVFAGIRFSIHSAVTDLGGNLLYEPLEVVETRTNIAISVGRREVGQVKASAALRPSAADRTRLSDAEDRLPSTVTVQTDGSDTSPDTPGVV